ncbi:MAG TPA: glycosyl hydrolase family 28-related protein [Candidatus Obscuribacterales bacterium]
MLPVHHLRQFLPASHLLLIALVTLFLTAQAAFAATVNVRDFGAVGDGVTDDQTAIQNAINFAAATPGSTVLFPPGNYLHTGQLTVNGVNLVGKGATITAGAFSASIVLGATGSTLSGLIIDATVGASIGVHFNNATQFSMRNTVIAAKFVNPLTVSFSSDGVIDGNQVGINSPIVRNRILGMVGVNRVVISNNTFIGNATATNGIDLQGADNDISIVSNLFTDGLGGVRFLNVSGNNFNISKNIILRAAASGISLLNTNSITVEKNTIRGLDLDAFRGINVDGTTNCRIIKNDINQFTTGIQTQNCTNISMVKNTISRCGRQGISVISGAAAAGAFVINKNGLSDCGLSGATSAVIEVGQDDFTSLAITGNSYKGSTANLAFFIRCLVPIPPTVAFGNKTATLLPSQFGP